jgi:hypothetical protein
MKWTLRCNHEDSYECKKVRNMAVAKEILGPKMKSLVLLFIFPCVGSHHVPFEFPFLRAGLDHSG